MNINTTYLRFLLLLWTHFFFFYPYHIRTINSFTNNNHANISQVKFKIQFTQNVKEADALYCELTFLGNGTIKQQNNLTELRTAGVIFQKKGSFWLEINYYSPTKRSPASPVPFWSVCINHDWPLMTRSVIIQEPLLL